MLRNLFHRNKSLLDSGVLKGMTDRHSHVLFGVDDGISTLEDSLAVLAFLEEQGVSELWCTPHIMEEVPNETSALRKRFAALCDAYNGNIKLNLGAEYMIDMLFEKRLEAGDLIVGEDGFLMLETYSNNPFHNIFDIFRKVRDMGYKPLFAHPERYRYLDETAYGELRGMGVEFQLNLPSLTGFYGDTVKEKACKLLEKGWYSYMGSDCHRLSVLKHQYEKKVISNEIALWLSGLK